MACLYRFCKVSLYWRLLVMWETENCSKGSWLEVCFSRNRVCLQPYYLRSFSMCEFHVGGWHLYARKSSFEAHCIVEFANSVVILLNRRRNRSLHVMGKMTRVEFSRDGSVMEGEGGGLSSKDGQPPQKIMECSKIRSPQADCQYMEGEARSPFPPTALKNCVKLRYPKGELFWYHYGKFWFTNVHPRRVGAAETLGGGELGWS